MTITRIDAGFMPFVWALSESAKIEAELGEQASPPPPTTSTTAAAPEGLMPLSEAIWLPELGGVISMKMLRGAIKRGDIDAIQPAGRGGSIFVTRTAVIAWINKCLAHQNPHASTSAPLASATAKSEPMPRGLSSMAEKKRALDAALKIAAGLKKR